MKHYGCGEFYISIDHAANEYKIPLETVEQWQDDGRFPTYRRGIKKGYLVDYVKRADFEACLTERQNAIE